VDCGLDHPVEHIVRRALQQWRDLALQLCDRVDDARNECASRTAHADAWNGVAQRERLRRAMSDVFPLQEPSADAAQPGVAAHAKLPLLTKRDENDPAFLHYASVLLGGDDECNGFGVGELCVDDAVRPILASLVEVHDGDDRAGSSDYVASELRHASETALNGEAPLRLRLVPRRKDDEAAAEAGGRMDASDDDDDYDDDDDGDDGSGRWRKSGHGVSNCQLNGGHELEITSKNGDTLFVSASKNKDGSGGAFSENEARRFCADMVFTDELIVAPYQLEGRDATLFQHRRGMEEPLYDPSILWRRCEGTCGGRNGRGGRCEGVWQVRMTLNGPTS
jgi:hypothetical protein